MKKILNWLTQWDKDKVLHFSLSLIISLFAAIVVKFLGGGSISMLCAAWFTGFVVGIVKEIYDDIKSNGSDSADWAADILGTTLGAIISFILSY